MPDKTEGPVRFQRKRSRGWRKPYGSIFVGRPTPMGNPFPVGGGAAFGLEKLTHQKAVDLYELWIVGDFDGLGDYKVFADMYRKHNGFDSTVLIPQLIHDLRGHNLLCWCGLDQPCHADTLLRICNQ